MIRKLKPGKYRLYSRKVDPKIGKRKNLGIRTNLFGIRTNLFVGVPRDFFMS